MSSTSLFSGPKSTARELVRVVFGASLGTAFEWYDFFVFATLATTLGPLFFPQSLGETGIFLASLATYASGLVLRPFGSIMFGKIGDTVGRKSAFVSTMALMGLSTFLVGLLPTYEQIGLWAPCFLVLLRCLQGLALGGEYGGAAIYVAEHVPTESRGYVTGWIQICATLGFFLSLVVVSICKFALSSEEFLVWGWRLPFLVSVVLCAVSYVIRSRLDESPIFLKMRATGSLSKAPLRDSFVLAENRKTIILSLFGSVAGVGIIWYTGQFYVLFFLTKTLKVDATTAHVILATALLLSLPAYILAGALSDRFGRKRVILIGFVLALCCYQSLFRVLTHYANPRLETAIASAPIKLSSAECGYVFFAAPASECSRMKDFLFSAGYPFSLVENGPDFAVHVGTKEMRHPQLEEVREALEMAGYPRTADPQQIERAMSIAVIFVMSLFTCLVYGPTAAYLVELFPPATRYSSLSISYHLGTGYFGGGMLYVSTLVASQTGDIYAGLYYPLGIIFMSLVIGYFFLPETSGRVEFRED